MPITSPPYLTAVTALAVSLLVGCTPQPTATVGDRPATSIPATPPTAPATPTHPSLTRAVGGKDSVTIGGVRAEVVSYRVGKPRIRSARGNEGDGSKDELVVNIRFTATSDTINRDVSNPADRTSTVTVRDEHGNDYTPFRPDGLVGSTEGQLTAENPVTKVFTAEKPIPKATQILLDIDASTVGERGTFRFSLPLDAGK